MTETKDRAVSQNITKRKIDNTTYVVKSFVSKAYESAVLSSVRRLIHNDVVRTH